MTSTIKVNTIKDIASTDIIKKCGTSITVGTASDTTTVAGNAVRSNALQASDGANIVSQVGTTITLGATGDNIVLAGGATQSGFGRTGTVDWITTPKTANFTAVSGEGYFCNTSGGSFNLILPSSPSAGDIVALKDYALTFDSNALNIDRNGSKINGATGTTLNISTEGASVVLVFVDSTKGWIPTQDDESSLVPASPTFITATGGTISTVDTNFKVHTFTGPGTFTVCSVGNPSGSNEISYVTIGGGGSGAKGNSHGGGGGAGGYREGKSPQDSYTASPIACTSGSNNGFPVSAQGYAIVIGGGGGPTTGSGSGAAGNPSSSFTLTSARGGGGGGYPGGNGEAGASGGGDGGPGTTGGTGNTPPTSPPQGNPSGTGASSSGGSGGGGATTAGNPPSSPVPSKGGTGATSSISGAAVERAGGGGGGGCNSGPASGGGGIGGVGSGNNNGGTATINTGGGGGGNGPAPGNGGGGGSGIVMIRYKFQ